MTVTQFPQSSSSALASVYTEGGYDVLLRYGQIQTIRLDEVELLEKNRGKAGALNFYCQYLRTKAVEWVKIGRAHV